MADPRAPQQARSPRERRDEAVVRRLLAQHGRRTDVGDRIERFSAAFLGAPYRASPLIGSADVPESFTISLRDFDCVTYVETVIALARSTTFEDFLAELRELRYRGGKVRWRSRNHYMTDWLRRNARRRAIAPLTLGAEPRWLERRLDLVPGLPAQPTRFAYLRTRDARARIDRAPQGAIVSFVSKRSTLDVFHCGFVIRHADGPCLRHATRSRAAVVDEPLRDFLSRNPSQGLLLAECLTDA